MSTYWDYYYCRFRRIYRCLMDKKPANLPLIDVVARRQLVRSLRVLDNGHFYHGALVLALFYVLYPHF